MKDVAIYGLPAAVGVNIGGSLAIGDIDMGNPAKFLIGVPWSKGEGVVSAVKAHQSGQPERAAEELAPAVIKNPMAAWRLYDQGQYSISGKPINFPGEAGPRKITALEAVGKAFGFQPVSSTKASDVRQSMEGLEKFVQNKQTQWANRYVNAYNRDDMKEMARISDEVREWNDRWLKAGKPEFTIKLRNAVRNRTKPYQPPRKLRALGDQYTEEYQ